MSKLKIKLSDNDIKSSQNIDNDNYIRKYLEKRYPGLNFSFLDNCGTLSFNSINFNNINVLIKKINQKINDCLNTHEDLIVWGDNSENGNHVGYAKESCRYVINNEDTNEFTVEKFVKDLNDDGYVVGLTSSEVIKKLSEGTKYSQTTYKSLDLAKKDCVNDFKN